MYKCNIFLDLQESSNQPHKLQNLNFSTDLETEFIMSSLIISKLNHDNEVESAHVYLIIFRIMISLRIVF